MFAKQCRNVCLGIAILVAGLLLLPALEAAAQTTDRPAAVLSMAGNWRAFYVLKGPVIRDGEKIVQMGAEVDTPAPPANWRDADFDDAAWQRLRGMPCLPHYYGGACAKADAGFADLDGSSTFQSLICVRGRFNVTDPAQAKDLTLTVEYRGGVVVWLNGREVARGNMPAGDVTAEALAEDYPADAFLTAGGKPQKENSSIKDPATIAEWQRIKRRIVDVKVPAGLLRKGMNVLAVEAHRSAYPKGYADEMVKNAGSNSVPFVRSTCAITDLVLKSPDGRGVTPNVVRPEGFEVWNSSVFAVDVCDWGDPLEPLRPIVIPTCRNGHFTAQVSVGSRSAIRGLKATMSDLKMQPQAGMPASQIPAANVLVRFGDSPKAPDEVKVTPMPPKFVWAYADAPAYVPGAVVPVRLTVAVPKDAAPGEYAGTLTVSAEGSAPVAVPVRVNVAGFTLADPHDWETVADVIQSPDTLAIQYGVPLWSEAHWKLIDRSFEVLGEVGLKTVYLPLIAETHFGNEQSMVRWIRKPDGTYDHDLSIVEKYLDGFEKRCGKPRFVCLYAWDLHLEGGSDWVNGTMGFMTQDVIKAREEHAKLKVGPAVTVVDPATGKTERMDLPQYSDAKSLPLWKPLGEKLAAILKRRGIDGRAFLGIPLDPKPTEGVTNFFHEVLPGVPWGVQAHIYHPGLKLGGATPAYQANVFVTAYSLGDPSKDLFGAKFPDFRLEFPRALTADLNPVEFRMLTERETMLGLHGFARVGGDLWPVKMREKGRPQMIPGRYPQTNAGGLSVWTYLLDPGPDGAVAPLRFEMLREGMEETEARNFIQRALLDGKLPAPLAERAKKLIVERNRALLAALTGKVNDPHTKQWWEHTMTSGFPGYAKSGYLWHLSSNPDAREKELFEFAAEVSGAIGGK